jgi:hypothetical protein
MLLLVSIVFIVLLLGLMRDPAALARTAPAAPLQAMMRG